MGSSQSSAADGSSSTSTTDKKKSLYQRAQDKKRGPGTTGLSDEDLQKYTGKTRAEFEAWKETAPGVGKHQLAGTITAGPTSGLGGTAAAGGLGGWGPDAVPQGPNRGMKFPPQKEQQAKVLEDDDD
ncbi:proteasome subunit alpha type 6 [Purpureocillium lavendulum]|uniref:Proteasome subunit alpha type 6 n=1 Tax=Purpureocillium lavendulum TaxID=1247861 RepID=A0AB34FME5_9HYPO|nr:proteasome subunit alpha type 6 [Purpureocillium lavendulum]